MPYRVIKVPGGYYVQNILTKAVYSKHPIKTLTTAKKQLTAIRIHK